MKKYGFVGTSTWEKRWFMRYLASLLTHVGSVGILSNALVDVLGYDGFETQEEVTIYRMDGFSPQVAYLLVDIEQHSNLALDDVFLMSDVHYHHILNNRGLFETYRDRFDRCYILYGLLDGSTVDTAYLMAFYHEDHKSMTIVEDRYNEVNQIWHHHNDHNHCLKLRGLSKAYKKNLTRVLEWMSIDISKEMKKQLRKE